MGVQPVKDVTLIRHAYIATAHRGKGLAGVLLDHLLQEAKGRTGGHLGSGHLGDPVLRKARVPAGHTRKKDRLLRTYWSIPGRQVETSVVLANATWLDAS
jgi:hypothetical protein